MKILEKRNKLKLSLWKLKCPIVRRRRERREKRTGARGRGWWGEWSGQTRRGLSRKWKKQTVVGKWRRVGGYFARGSLRFHPPVLHKISRVLGTRSFLLSPPFLPPQFVSCFCLPPFQSAATRWRWRASTVLGARGALCQAFEAAFQKPTGRIFFFFFFLESRLDQGESPPS